MNPTEPPGRIDRDAENRMLDGLHKFAQELIVKFGGTPSNELDFKESQYAHSLRTESDRGCLLVGMSDIDEALGDLLLLALTPIDGSASDAKWLLDPRAGNRPLASLAVRTKVAHCLGYIGADARKILDAIRGLRNDHAHGTVPFAFTEDNTRPILLACPQWAREFLASIYASDNHSAPRRQFVYVVMGVVTAIKITRGKLAIDQKLASESKASAARKA